MILIGLDPDLHGGIAAVRYPDRQLLALSTMPVCEGPEGEMIDAVALSARLTEARQYGDTLAIVERALVMAQASAGGARMMGAVGRIHQNYGTVRSVAILTATRVEYAWPSSWKKAMSLTKDKDASLDMAAELFPTHAAVFQKKKRHGLAEALLLAEWGARVHLGAQDS